MEDNDKIKNLIQHQKYDECIKIIKAKIVEYIINIINEKGIEYEYSNIIELIEVSEEYINDDRKYIARNLEYFSFDEDDILCLERLLDICKTYNIR